MGQRLMLGNHGRSITAAIFTPLARVLAAARITPNMVTVAGTVATITVATVAFPLGYIWQGVIALGVVLFMDSVDGILARMTSGGTTFGAFLDSTLDRLADGAVFASLVAYAILQLPGGAARSLAIGAGLAAIVGAGAVPYARARAESVGVEAKVGIAERTDRLVIALVGALLTGLDLNPWFLAAALSWVAFASFVTVVQRIVVTARALRASTQ